jgi:D-alanine-D-alanine ligase
MNVKGDWWKDFFNEIYLITDARSVCDPDLTRREADLIEEVLQLDKHDRILDLCGGHGRHSLELAKRGYRDLTVFDFSGYLINLGKRLAREAGSTIKFVCGDARSSGLKSNDYSAIFVMANSFGYSSSERKNHRMLKEMKRLLRRGGKLLLDLTDPDHVKNNLKPCSWHEANDDIIVCRERKLSNNVIKAREVVLSKKKGLLRDGYYCERLYHADGINKLLGAVGFVNAMTKRNISLHRRKKDYGFLTSRMIVTATKP